MPDHYNCGEADADKDDVKAEYQAVDDCADDFPLLRSCALLEVIFHEQADGRQVLGQHFHLSQDGVMVGADWW